MIPVYRPDLSGNERNYVLQCLDTSWISSIGEFIGRFESAFQVATNIPHAISVSNGTVALHLALHCLDVGPGDEVIVPTFTYIASVNAIAQTGATPVFAECKAHDWLLDPAGLERLITKRTKAIMPVHLYGAVCDMPEIMKIAEKHGLKVIEDAAEALGSSLDGVHVGSFGDVGSFSFFGNKTITTGEGGMVACRDATLAARLRKVKGQGQSATRRYWHDELGFNYRMTNICAAIGLGQIERLDEILARKHKVAQFYRRALQDSGVTFQRPLPGVISSDWLCSMLLPPGTNRDDVMINLQEQGVESRPVFYCAHHMPMYKSSERFPHSEDVAARGISLPSFPTLTEAELHKVVDALKSALSSA